MEESRDQWPAIRIVHLVGGGRVINELNPEVRLVPDTLSSKSIRFTSRSYTHLYLDIRALGLSPIGVEFFQHQLELDGKQPPDWQPYLEPWSATWGAGNSMQTWAQIAHAAFTKKLAKEWDIAARIRYQLSALPWRLHQISTAYHQQLTSKVASGEFKNGVRFEDGFTDRIYLALHAFLVDACVLRDYLAEFLASFVFSEYLEDGVSIRNIANLRKRVLRTAKDESALAAVLWDDTDEQNGGWLARLGAYRDLIVHSAPLAHAESRLFISAYLHPIDGDPQFPCMHCPVPNNPIEIKKRRSRSDHVETFDDLLAIYAGISGQNEETTDGLAYAWEVIAHLSALAQEIAAHSPVAAKPITVAPEDTIDGIKTVISKR